MARDLAKRETGACEAHGVFPDHLKEIAHLDLLLNPTLRPDPCVAYRAPDCSSCWHPARGLPRQLTTHMHYMSHVAQNRQTNSPHTMHTQVLARGAARRLLQNGERLVAPLGQHDPLGIPRRLLWNLRRRKQVAKAWQMTPWGGRRTRRGRWRQVRGACRGRRRWNRVGAGGGIGNDLLATLGRT